MEDVKKLKFNDTGIFLIITSSGSKYILNLNEKTLVRSRDKENELSVPLRKNEEEIQIFGMSVEVTKPAIFLLEPLGKGNATIRTTTTIISIFRFDRVH